MRLIKSDQKASMQHWREIRHKCIIPQDVVSFSNRFIQMKHKKIQVKDQSIICHLCVCVCLSV